MKKLLFLFAVLTVGLMSCKKDKDKESDEDLYENVPQGNIPSTLGPGNWRSSSVSTLGLYSSGTHVANSEESHREYEIASNGRAKFVSYVATASAGCYPSSFAYYEGAIYFDPNEPNTFLWTPVKGHTVYRNCSGQVTRDEAMTKAQLKDRISKVYYKIERPFAPAFPDEYIYTYENPSMTQSSFIGSYKIIK